MKCAATCLIWPTDSSGWQTGAVWGRAEDSSRLRQISVGALGEYRCIRLQSIGHMA